METGLDALHYGYDPSGVWTVYFSTEVDVEIANSTNGLLGNQQFEDEDLIGWNPVAGLHEVFDVKNMINAGVDYGLDAASFVEREGMGYWAFSTEVGGTAMIEGSPEDFTDGDILVWSTEGLTLLSLEEVFGRNVGLDALHVLIEEAEGPNDMDRLTVIMSTEVDGEVRVPDQDLLELIPFKDEDILVLNFLIAEDGPPVFDGLELAWEGIPSFGRDVGLDAVYVEMIPEPATMLLMGLGLCALALRLRRKS